jgi:hypothetical protein
VAKKKASSDQKLKATAKQLRADLKESEAKRTAWKKRATKAEKSVADLQSRLRRADKQARKALEQSRASVPVDAPAPATSHVATSTTDAPTGPDASWTVVQLRAEGRRRGLSGLSGKSKAELVEALA